MTGPSVEVEFLNDVPHWYDDGVWASGSRMMVDANSAKAMVDSGKAKLIGAPDVPTATVTVDGVDQGPGTLVVDGVEVGQAPPAAPEAAPPGDD